MAPVKLVFTLFIIAAQILYGSARDCGWRYFKHYEQKACVAVIGSDGCPEKFRCNKLSDEDRKTCVHNGKTYKVGGAISDLGPCDSCRCEMKRHGRASIECAEVDCPDWEAKNKSCYMGYVLGQCCPQEMCPGDKELQKTCYHNGVHYKIGQYIETSNPCKSCICTEQWRNEDGPGCSPVDCLTGIYADQIRSGCLPIYREKGCCAVEMYCDSIYGVTPAFSVQEDEDLCYYQGQYYERGSVAYLKNDLQKCVTCKCTTPPDFTCIRKTCPMRPRKG